MRLAVTGLGMVSSVGRDVVTACASIRAGIRRPSELLGSTSQSDPEAEPAPVIGYALRGFADGFAYLGLWRRIAQGSLADMSRNAGLDTAANGGPRPRTGLALVTPEIDPDRFPEAEALGLSALGEKYAPLLDLAALGIEPRNVWVVSQGSAGTAVAAWQADQLIGAGRLDRVVVLAVDSYLDRATLGWLGMHGRLKSDDNPAGLIPGEAGACFLLESEKAARERGAVIQAVLLGAAAAHEPAHFFTDDVNTGVGLATAGAAVLPPGSSFLGDVYVDLNGEPWRGQEYGYARVRLGRSIAEDAPIRLVCDSLGEIGAATGAVSVCMAARSFVRGYDSNRQALVLSSSEHGHVGAMLLAAA
jgi:3-oxoacyl-[acyl-carrier-protein] synthase-1